MRSLTFCKLLPHNPLTQGVAQAGHQAYLWSLPMKLLTAQRHRIPAVVAGAFVAFAVLAVVSTYSVFSGAFDEPSHVAAGMEWLDRGQFTYEPMNPPLARVAVALGPYLAGIRSFGSANRWREGRNILYAEGAYRRNLALARLGVLPFFILAAAVVWLWTRRLFDAPTATAAVALFATLPPVLAHSGLATTDFPVTATTFAALYAFTLWLEERTMARSLWLGLAVGLAVLAKFSALIFLPAGGLAVLALWLPGRRRGTTTEAAESDLGWSKAIPLALAAGGLVVWTGYRFSFGSGINGPPLPAPEFWRGLADLIDKQKVGHEAFLFGEISTTGWWYFFPVTLAVKTPIPFMLLTAVGTVTAARAAIGEARTWRSLAPVAAALAVVLVTLPASLNIGLRHVLLAYPLAAVVAGHGAAHLWRSIRGRLAKRAAVGVLLIWQLAATWRAHPDYLPWFNELAGREPDRILVNADLDWGQDLLRLADAVRARGIDSLALAYYGSADPSQHLANVRPMAPFERPSGWFAVSVAVIKGLHVPDWTGFEWLESVEPVAEIGKSIRLYNLTGEKRQ